MPTPYATEYLEHLKRFNPKMVRAMKADGTLAAHVESVADGASNTAALMAGRGAHWTEIQDVLREILHPAP